MQFVLDASMTMAWCFEDETTTETEDVLTSLLQAEALTSSIWCLEVTNAVLVAVRAKRITLAKGEQFLSLLAGFPIVPESRIFVQVHQHVVPLAREHDLSCYDAAYLELALRENLPLATLDAGLRKAAQRIGVSLLT